MSQTPTQYVLTPPAGMPSTETIHRVTDLTNSSINTFNECPRKFELMYVEGLRTEKEPDYFRIGGAYHLAHEVLGKTGSVAEAVKAIRQNYEDPPDYIQEDESLTEAWYYEAVTCICLFRGWVEYYSNRYPDPLDEVSVIATEQVFDVPIRNPVTGAITPRFRRKGKIDKIILLRDRRNAVKEFKTSGEDIEPGSNYWWKLKIDSQISGYYVAAKYMGYRIDTVVYDVARKPTIRPSLVPVLDSDGLKQVVCVQTGERVMTKDGKRWKQSVTDSAAERLVTRKMDLQEWEAKLMADIRSRFEHYYVRDEIVRLDDDLTDYEVDLWNQQGTIAAAEAHGRFYRNTRACTRNRSMCPMFRICTGQVGYDADGVPEGYRRATSPHEELEN